MSIFSNSTTARSYQLTYYGQELILNEHVGNEWAHGVWLNDIPLVKGEPVRLAAGRSYDLAIVAAEQEETYNDQGDESVVLSPALLAQSFPNGEFYLDVKVVEHNGRYAGGVAVWRFYFLLE
ncbi:MAG: hypothetical protein AAF433_13210 [Bacteroidota bacterium]